MISKLDRNITNLMLFALKEYGDSTLHKKELMESDRICECFGSLIADISVIIAVPNRLYLRKYDICDSDGGLKISFILGQASMLFAMSSRKFRENLIDSGNIKGVITLKQGVIEDIYLPMALIILQNDNTDTWFTSAENMENLIALLKGNFESVQYVYYSSNISADSLLPEFYNGDDELIEKSFEGSQTKALEEIAEIIGGKGVKRDEYVNDGIPYLRASDIQNGKILKPDVFISEEKVNSFSKQLIQEGDILLTKYWGQNKLAIVTQNDVPAIASSGLFIIRPYGVSDRYLYNYLTSKTGNDIFVKQLNRVQRGSIVSSVTISDLRKIIVPVFDHDVMRNIECIESISEKDAVSTIKKLMTNIKSESELEMTVKKDLLDAGWEVSSFITGKDASIVVNNDKKFIADYTYMMPDGRIVIIEIKSDIMRINADWVETINYILSGENDYIFILTTGAYYEIHMSGVSQSLKLLQPPTIAQILAWEKEVR